MCILNIYRSKAVEHTNAMKVAQKRIQPPFSCFTDFLSFWWSDDGPELGLHMLSFIKRMHLEYSGFDNQDHYKTLLQLLATAPSGNTAALSTTISKRLPSVSRNLVPNTCET